MRVFLKHNILNEREILARQEILFENYSKTLCIEGHLLSDIIATKVLPPSRVALENALETLKKARDIFGKDAESEENFAKTLLEHISQLQKGVLALDEAIAKTTQLSDCKEQAANARDAILPAMSLLRKHADALEKIVDDSLWQLPKYSELLWIH